MLLYENSTFDTSILSDTTAVIYANVPFNSGSLIINRLPFSSLTYTFVISGFSVSTYLYKLTLSIKLLFPQSSIATTFNVYAKLFVQFATLIYTSYGAS